MDIVRILIIAAVGTALMTLFSYGVGYITKKPFREPELLNALLAELTAMRFGSSRNHPVGWIIHYNMGFMFVVCYQLISHLYSVPPTLLYYTIAGAVSGVVGITGWHIVFKLHPKPPPIDLNEYYAHLFLAHVVFGVGVYGGVMVIGG